MVLREKFFTHTTADNQKIGKRERREMKERQKEREGKTVGGGKERKRRRRKGEEKKGRKIREESKNREIKIKTVQRAQRVENFVHSFVFYSGRGRCHGTSSGGTRAVITRSVSSCNYASAGP